MFGPSRSTPPRAGVPERRAGGRALARGAALLAALCVQNAAAAREIEVLGLFHDRAVVSIDGQQRVLAAGKPSPEGITLISADSREAVLEIDGHRASYALGTHIGTQFQPPAPGTVVTVAPDTSGMYRVDGSINGFQVDFIVDTGATLISLNRNEAKRMGIDYRMLGHKALSDTAAGPEPVYLLTLGHVRVGDIELRDVSAAVHDGDHPDAVLLGNSFLSRIDLERQGDLLLLKSR